MRPLIFLAIATGMVLTPQAVKARDHDDDHGRKHWRDDDDEDRDRHRRHGDECFREEHIRVIRDYYHEHELPPGLVKKYYRTRELPPGWDRRIQPLPYEVERGLPPVPEGYARGYVDGYAVIYQPRTHFVIDFHAVFGN